MLVLFVGRKLTQHTTRKGEAFQRHKRVVSSNCEVAVDLKKVEEC